MTATETHPAGVVPLTKNPDYLRWFISDVAADAGGAIRAFAMPLIGLAVTGSLTLAGALGAASMLAALATMLPGGVIADRYDRRRLLTIGHAFGAFVWTLGIVLFFTGLLNTPALFVIAILGGVREGFFGAVSLPALRQLVHSSQLPRAIAANQARDGAIELAAGPVGGFLVALSVWAPFAAQAIGHTIAWFATLTIRADLRPLRDANSSGELTAAGQIRRGFTWLREHRTVTVLLITAAITSTGFSGAIQTLVLWLADAGESTTRIGFVSTAMAVGMIAGSLLAGPLASRIPTGKLAVSATLWSTTVFTLLIVVRDFNWILTIAAVASLAFPVFNAAASGWAVAQIPHDQMGAITGAAGLLNNLILPLAPLIAGVGLDRLGYGATMSIFIAILLLGTAGIIASREFRRLGRPDQWNEAD